MQEISTLLNQLTDFAQATTTTQITGTFVLVTDNHIEYFPNRKSRVDYETEQNTTLKESDLLVADEALGKHYNTEDFDAMKRFCINAIKFRITYNLK